MLFIKKKKKRLKIKYNLAWYNELFYTKMNVTDKRF